MIADEQRAQAIGVSGVPFFVLAEKYAISGGQSPDYFLRALDTIWNEAHPQANEADGGSCAPDGCAL